MHIQTKDENHLGGVLVNNLKGWSHELDIFLKTYLLTDGRI
jgi:hypothetical protein